MCIRDRIAGSYTPFALKFLPAAKGLRFCLILWGIALAGIVMKLLWINAPRLLTSALYLAMGWSIVFVPVSYTHLDVYKRQAWARRFLPSHTLNIPSGTCAASPPPAAGTGSGPPAGREASCTWQTPRINSIPVFPQTLTINLKQVKIIKTGE